MLVAGIKSRPQYTGLVIDPHAKRHLFALEAEGAQALIDQLAAVEDGFLEFAEILYVAGASASEDHAARLSGLGADTVWLAPTIAPLLVRLKANLVQARMGTRLYLAGTEGFIGQTMQVALDFGIDFKSIRTEHRGSLARRVQCVHCKGITEAVTTSLYACSHCGLTLLVRDHYSRRIGAFQGVNVDAEEPGTAPQAEEIFP